MKSQNIVFKSSSIVNFFRNYRDKWRDFYPSEIWAFEKLAGDLGTIGSILDVGCASGGLGLALSERYKIGYYTGIDSNQQAIDYAVSRRAFPMRTHFHCCDICLCNHFDNMFFDVVFSLSCADWNVDTNDIINACWRRVQDGGYFVISVRLTNLAGINDINISYQKLAADGAEPGEIANYVVYNFQEFLAMVSDLKPAGISGYGYYGKPSETAVTIYGELVFAVFIIKKPDQAFSEHYCSAELNLPLPLLLG